MVRIAKIGHIGLRSGDVEAMLSYYTGVLGLTVTEKGDDGTAYLSTSVDHHSVALLPGSGSGFHHVAFQIDRSQSLSEAAEELRGKGVETELRTDAEPGVPELLQFADPEGNVIQLYGEVELAGGGFGDTGIVPHKLGHVALNARDVRAVSDFYQGALGFRWSDWMADFFVFLRCGPDHHSMNFIRAENPSARMHHFAFELGDWSHVQAAGDVLAKSKIPIIWGPSRHGIGHNIFTYHRDPDGNVVELYAQLDVMLNEALGYFEPRPWHEDYPQRPKVWEDVPLAASPWGSHPPQEMMG